MTSYLFGRFILSDEKQLIYFVKYLHGLRFHWQGQFVPLFVSDYPTGGKSSYVSRAAQ